MPTIALLIFFSIGCGQRNPSPTFFPVAGNSSFVSHEQKHSVYEFLDSIHFHSSEVCIFIDKADYRLYLFKDTSILKAFPVVLGPNPLDDKLRQGDGCTPEGVFAIRDKYPHDKWSKFIWIDYPNMDSRKKHSDAKHSGRIPMEAAIGGEVGIHGVPSGMNW
jgi:murein L,D-transpeptidase YafK